MCMWGNVPSYFHMKMPGQIQLVASLSPSFFRGISFWPHVSTVVPKDGSHSVHMCLLLMLSQTPCLLFSILQDSSCCNLQ